MEVASTGSSTPVYKPLETQDLEMSEWMDVLKQTQGRERADAFLYNERTVRQIPGNPRQKEISQIVASKLGHSSPTESALKLVEDRAADYLKRAQVKSKQARDNPDNATALNREASRLFDTFGYLHHTKLAYVQKTGGDIGDANPLKTLEELPNRPQIETDLQARHPNLWKAVQQLGKESPVQEHPLAEVLHAIRRENDHLVNEVVDLLASRIKPNLPPDEIPAFKLELERLGRAFQVVNEATLTHMKNQLQQSESISLSQLKLL